MLSVFLTFAFVRNLSATTIVVIVTSDFVILGVDSKLTIEDGITGEKLYQETVKLFKTGNYFYAASGVMGTMDSLNLHARILGRRIKNGTNFDSLISLANLEIKNSLFNQAMDIKKRMPYYFYNHYMLRMPVFSYAIIGVKNGKPFAYTCDVVSDNTEAFRLKFIEQEFPLPTSLATDAKAFYVGAHEAINDYTKNPAVFAKHPDQVIEDLLMVEVNNTPDKVGLPLNIVKIYKDGNVEWLKRSKDCPIEIK